MTRDEDIWQCVDCGGHFGRHDMWFEGDLCGECDENHNQIKTVAQFLDATGFARGTNHPSPSTLKAKMEELNVSEDAKIDIMSFFLYDNESTD